MLIKVNLLFYLGIPILIGLGISLALTPSSSAKLSYTNSSYASDFSEIQNFELDLIADFNSKIMIGSVRFEIQIKVKDFRFLYFDMNLQNITNITLINNLNESIVLLPYLDFDIQQIHAEGQISEEDELEVGKVLKIIIPKGFFQNYTFNDKNLNIQILNSTFSVIIDYTTSPNLNGRGINWLEPSMTFMGQYPYFYSNFRPISIRSLSPFQDSLFLNSIFSAKITVPSPLSVEMSANLVSQTIVKPSDINTKKADLNLTTSKYTNLDFSIWKVYEFSQPFKTTAFLINIAIGVFEETVLRRVDNITYLLVTEKGFMGKCLDKMTYFNTSLIQLNNLLNIEMVISRYFQTIKFLIMPKSYYESILFSPNLNFLPYSLISSKETAFIAMTKILLSQIFGVLHRPTEWADVYLILGFQEYFFQQVLKKISLPLAAISWNISLQTLEERFRILCDVKSLCILTELQPNIFGINVIHMDDFLVVEVKGRSFFEFLGGLFSNVNNQTNEANFLSFAQKIIGDENYFSLDSKKFLDWYIRFLVDVQPGPNKRAQSIKYRKQIRWEQWWNYHKWNRMIRPSNRTSDLVDEVIGNLSNLIKNGIFMDKKTFNSWPYLAKNVFLTILSKQSQCNESLIKKLEEIFYISGETDCELRKLFVEMKLNYYEKNEANFNEILKDLQSLVEECMKMVSVILMGDYIRQWRNVSYNGSYSSLGNVFRVNNEQIFHPFMKNYIKLSNI